MDNSDSISDWISSLKRGNEDAAQKIWERYYQDLVVQANRKLGSRPRREADEEDIVQDAFAGFFKAVEAGRFPDLRDRHDLWAVLFVIVDRRAKDRLRRALALKEGGGRVRGQSAFAAGGGNDSRNAGFSLIADRQVTPESLDETIAVLKESFATLELDPQLCAIATSKLQGFKNSEIAEEHRMTLRSVERKLRLIREQIEHELTQ